MAPSTEVRPPPAVEKKPATDPKKEKEAKKAEDDLSEEDKQLRDELTMLVERLSENDTSLYMPSLETMRTLIRASTTSMTSVPKPLKFMRVHFDAMKKIHEKITDDATKKFCADIISVLSMTMSEKRECLGYKLNGSNEPIDQWGHEYVRHLAGEIAAEWGEIPENDSKKEKLLSLTNEVVPYHLQHNAEAEACDLAMEIERLDVIEKYIDNATYPRSGALLACGIVSAGVRDECDPPLALLTDYVVHTNNVMRIGPILGLGLAYAGSNRPEVLELLLPVLAEANAPMELIGLAALSCGLISVGARNIEVTATVLQTLMEKTPDELKDPFAKFLPLALGLSYLGKQELADVTLTALDVLADPFRSMAKTLVEVCAYAGSGNVLKVQNLLHICSEHYDGTSAETTKKKEKKDDKDKKDDKEKGKEEKKDEPSVDLSQQQAIAVLGIALIAMGEEIGAEMCMRTFGHLLRYCEPAIRRAVPLAMGLLSVSNPQMSIVDTLSKFSHDHDPEVEYAAVLAMGLVGAGTNNARIAALLRQLAQYYYRDPNSLFMVRIAQGLVHLGKGTMTMNPYHSDKQLLSPVALAGLLATLVAALDCKHTILGKSHYLLYCLVTAIHPRMLVTFDEDLQPLPVSVRVGQAVDVVGQAGKPKTITGFQTHTTPVLLSFGERAELATEEFVPCTNVLEGFVILRKNPDYTD
ncbi:unnamed protein product [Notodromas monacha]|uniref:26S proteasome non-ATPase regulatory subunit 2 n=1 Tax=Notodromas monacha TaxID=399045 RepID=A0A7R9BZZ4_9CRUS|nr:unnamed protein product [Notodromas monacha]CAG0923795.1 unnamed protein product [Notodromas monacha]